ncbi:MAG: GDP-L-fucose synthase [Proteobacteria bacterium]|nr:GDP-L-fucose synthase [Pseudomonadota bacterium]MBI3498796.1 GDP-L-fucose synthase [Pseudomonadota bacterium]
MAAGTLFPLAHKRVWVAGHKGMVGAALARRLAADGATVLTVERAALDLRQQAAVEAWLAEMRPDAIILAAAVVGGILANDSRPAEFLYDNLAIEANVIHAAAKAGVAKLMFLGSSCVYPRLCAQPMREEALLTGPLEPTNEWYAVAKIAGIKLCQAYRRQHGKDFIAVIPTNLYGPGDNFDLGSSHVVPALIRKVDAATSSGGPVEIWGTGTPRREFLYVDDAADGLVFLMERYSNERVINLGLGEDVSIAELASRIAAVIGYHGEFRYLADKPDGMPLKRLEGSRLAAMGWKPRTDLDTGLGRTHGWYRETVRRAA